VGWSERGKADRVAAFPASVLNFHFRGRLSSKLSNLNKAQHKCAWQPLAKLPLWPSSPGESPPNNVPAMLEWSQHTHTHWGGEKPIQPRIQRYIPWHSSYYHLPVPVQLCWRLAIWYNLPSRTLLNFRGSQLCNVSSAESERKGLETIS